MSGFSADWLALREAADTASRAKAVLDAATTHFANHRTDAFQICDLGSGTGASVAAFSRLFPRPQQWCLVDSDATNLDRAIVRYDGDAALGNVVVLTKVHDLSVDPAPWGDKTNLVTATALFDLTSKPWISGFADRLCADELPLLATLTYDGRHTFVPHLPLDDDMNEAFNAHQRGDKGFGSAAGPDAAEHIQSELSLRGYRVTSADSSWNLDGNRDATMIAELLDGWVGAVIERDLVPEAQARAWHTERLANTTLLQVGHVDIFAAPPEH